MYFAISLTGELCVNTFCNATVILDLGFYDSHEIHTHDLNLLMKIYDFRTWFEFQPFINFPID